MRLKILITVLLNNKTFVNELVSELATLSYLVCNLDTGSMYFRLSLCHSALYPSWIPEYSISI